MQQQSPPLFHPGSVDHRQENDRELRRLRGGRLLELVRTMRRVPPRESVRRERTRYWRKRGRHGPPPRTPWRTEVLARNDKEFANVLGKFTEFRRIDQFCDGVVVSADGKTYKVHRVLLASNSDYFRAAFRSPQSSSESVVNLEFPSSVVDVIVEFCYTRSCSITEQNVQQVLKAAGQMGIISLVDFCCKFLSENLTLNNAYGIFRFASVYGCGELASKAWNMLLNKFVSFIDQSPEFPEVVVDDLALLLSNSYLNIPSESVAFRAMLEWINASPAEREKHANRLWECVRFGLMSPEYYRTDVLTVPFIQSVSSTNLWTAMSPLKQIEVDPELEACTPRVPHQVVFAVGGWSVGAPTNCMETYDIRADRWFMSSFNDEAPRAYHGLVSVDNILYMIGGFDGTTHFNSVRCYDPMTKVWTEKACMHRQRCYVSCVVVDREIYAIGGFNSNTRMSSVERYSVADNQWTFVPPMTRRRSDCGAVVVGSKIYVAGGFDGQEVLQTAEYYDTETESWHELPNLNNRRSGVCLVHYRECIYAIGGFNGGARRNSVERLSISRSTQWQMDVPSMITQRSNFCCVVLEDKIYAIGGFNGLETIRNCECFDGEKWFEICGMNQNRSALAVGVCEGLQNAVDYTSTGHRLAHMSRCQATQVQGAAA